MQCVCVRQTVVRFSVNAKHLKWGTQKWPKNNGKECIWCGDWFRNVLTIFWLCLAGMFLMIVFFLFFVTKNAESLFFSKSDPFHRWRHWYLLNTIRIGSTFSIRIKDVGSVFCCCYLHCCCLCSSRPHCLCGWWRSRRDSWTSGRESRLLRRDHARRNRNSLHFRFPTNIPFRPYRYCFELSSCKDRSKKVSKNLYTGARGIGIRMGLGIRLRRASVTVLVL